MTALVRPRVLYVLSRYPVLSETFVSNEIAGLRESGVEVDVLTVREPAGGPHSEESATAILGPVRLRDAVVSNVRWATRHPARYATFLRSLIRLRGAGARLALGPLVVSLLPTTSRATPSAVHTHFAWGAAPLTVYAGRLLGARTSITVHANDIYRPSVNLARLLPEFDRIVTVCEYNVDYLRGLRLRLDDIRIVPCGVDVPVLEAPPTGTKLVLSVGRLVPKKGFVTLVRAFEQVLAKHPDSVLHIIGEGPERGVLEQEIGSRGLAASIELIGAVEHGEVLERLGQADIFALMCEPETDGAADALPVAIREAMVRARPVVSTRLAGIPEALGSAGLLVEPKDVSGCATAICEVFDDASFAEKIGTRARERVIELATLGHTTRGMLNVLLGT